MGEPSKTNQIRKRVGVAILGMFVLAAGLAVIFQPKPHYYASPVVTSGAAQLGYFQGSMSEAVLSWPPDQQLPDFTRKHSQDSRFDLIAVYGSPPPRSILVPSPDFGFVRMSDLREDVPNSATIEIVGYAVHVPTGPVEVAPLQVHKIDEEEVDWEDLPKSWFQVEQAEFLAQPTLRAFFQTKTPGAAITDGNIWDERTGRVVGHFESSDTRQGDLHFADFNLGIWHNTQLALDVIVISGPMQRAELKLEAGAQVQFGDRFCVGFGLVADGDIFTPPSDAHDPFRDLLHLYKTSQIGDAKGSSVVLIQPYTLYHYHLYCLEDSQMRRPEFVEANQNLLQTVLHFPDRQLQEGDSIQLGFLPYRTRVRFQLKPTELPNPEDIDNLFEANIPFVRFDKGRSFDPFVDLAPSAEKFVTDAVEFEHTSIPGGWDDVPERYNTTPRELIEFMTSFENAQVVISPEAREIRLQPTSSWFEDVREWWSEFRAKWL